MSNVLLLSSAYSWFIGLLVIMLVMAVLFVLIALTTLKPIKMDELQASGVSEAKRLLEKREAQLTMELLNSKEDKKVKDELESKLRDVATAEKIVAELIKEEYGESAVTLGVDTALSEEEAENLEKSEKRSIEQTFETTGEQGLKKSFSAQLIQSSDNTKVWYFELKNCILCYEKTKARMGWNNEKFYIGKNNVATLTLRGKTLCLYLALKAENYAGTFPVKASTSNAYKDVTPCLFRIKSGGDLKKAKELIALLMSDYGVMYLRTNHSIYALPYEDDDALIAKGLAKYAQTKPATTSEDKKEDKKEA